MADNTTLPGTGEIVETIDIGSSIKRQSTYSTALIANPTSTYTRPSDTSGYSINDLVSNNTTAGSVTVQSFTAARSPPTAGAGMVRRLRLYTNHTTGLSGVQFRVRLWTAAPTYTNGDNGAYAVATGAAGCLGHFVGTFEQQADGAWAVLSPVQGSEVNFAIAASTLYWDMETLTAFTPQASKTFTVAAEVVRS